MTFIRRYSRPEGGANAPNGVHNHLRGKVEEEERDDDEERRREILSVLERVSFFLTFSAVLETKHRDWKRLWNAKMGCCFSKKSKRKSAGKEDLSPTTAAVETTTGNDAVPLGNSTEEAPKQYSWDKREKVTRWSPETPQQMTRGVHALSQTHLVWIACFVAWLSQTRVHHFKVWLAKCSNGGRSSGNGILRD